VNREFALSGDGAAAEIVVGIVFRPERRLAFPDSIRTIHLVSNG
jgi:hypothetical protein